VIAPMARFQAVGPSGYNGGMALLRAMSRTILWLRSQEIVVFVGLALTVGGVWAFVELADEVVENETESVDETIIRWMRRPGDLATPRGPIWLHEAGRDITALGGVMVLTIVTSLVAGFLAMRRQYHAMWFVIIATVGGQVLSSTLKWLIDRPRPSVVPHLSHVNTPSFPSGHAMLSAVVYLTLGVLLVRFVSGRRYRIYFMSVALALTFLVGVSRVYMGVHYPTDVLAGWTAGLVWAVVCWLVARHLQRRHTLERPDQQTHGAGTDGGGG
jgi:undecaprenyl-diphosphatase